MISLYNNSNSADTIISQPFAAPCQANEISLIDAVRIIERTYRNHRSTIDLLQERSVKKLPFSRFKRLILLVAKQEIKKNLTTPYLESLNDILFQLDEAREKYYKSHPKIPVFNIQSPDHLIFPVKVVWIDSSRIEEFPQKRSVKMTISSLTPFRKLPPILITQKKLNQLNGLFGKLDAFAWNYQFDGCNERANLMLLYMRALKMNDANLQKAYVVGPDLKFTAACGRRVSWIYHVAPLVTDTHGSKWVIDPLISPHRAMKRKEWAAAIVIKENSCASDYGFFNGNTICTNPNETITFFSTRMSGVKVREDGGNPRQLNIKLKKITDKKLYSRSMKRFSKWHSLAESHTIQTLRTTLFDKING